MPRYIFIIVAVLLPILPPLEQWCGGWLVSLDGVGELDVEYAVWGAKCESCELRA